MSKEKEKAPIRLTERARNGLGLLAAGSVLAGGGYMALEHNEPEMHGHKIVVVDRGDTVDEIINVHVEGGASHTGAVRAEVMSDPDNADVFENGQLDPGEELEVPEKVTN